MSKRRGVIIVGSSTSTGNTMKVALELGRLTEYDIIDLQKYEIGIYDYDHNNLEDDFFPLMESIIANYDQLIFATPIYWYSMSATLKIFFDRISDLLDIRKELGRQLRGKSMGAVSCSAHDDQGDFFWKPFELTADYLGMKYAGHIHSVVEGGEINELTMRRIGEYVGQLRE